ncbi:MAG: hypothetical protein JXR91_15290 [Deltaproteobacteria bacterium]|nr:hypothetical protein [Deltaproteobacteria bacterium]
MKKKVTIPPSVPKSPILLIANPTSQGGKAKKRINLAIEMLKEKKVPFEFKPTLPDGKTVDLVKNSINNEGFRTVVYMGGDGTFYEVAKGIVKSDYWSEVRMGMLPAGTANDQGKSFGISSSVNHLDENINIILRGNTESIDVGKVEAFDINNNLISTDFFFDSIGWGLSAAILAFRNKELEKVKKVPVIREMYRDQTVYIRAGIHVFGLNWLTRDTFSTEFEIDNTIYSFNGITDIIISNTSVYAGEWLLAQDSSASDGLFEIAIFKGLGDWGRKLVVKHKKNPLPFDIIEKIGLSETTDLKGKKIKIKILRPSVDKRLPAQRDGEEFIGADDYTVEVFPNSLSLIVPKNFHWI